MLMALAAVALAACASPSTNDTVARDDRPPLQAECGPVAFTDVPPDLDEFPLLDAEAQQAIDELVGGAAVVDGGTFGVDTQWSVASRSDDVLVLFGHQQADAPTVFAQFVMRSGSWTATGWGGCWVQIESPGFGPATVSTDPAALPMPTDIELALFITEQSCASGLAPEDRDVMVLVSETAEEVNIIALVASIEGDAECPSNPLHPVAVTLDKPLGQRTLVDGHRFPNLPVVPAEDVDN